MLAAALLGQGLSAVNSLSGILSSALVKQGVSLPATQTLLNYICLALIYGTCLIVRKQPVKEAWWKFAFLSLTECLATFTIVTAYRFTSLTSVTLLNCFAIPSVLVLSQLILKAKYKARHWIGAGICMAGLAVLVISDQSSAVASVSSKPFLGDCLALLGATLYAVTNVTQEKLLGDVGKLEVLAMGGTFGTLFSGLLAFTFERHQAMQTNWTITVVGLTIGFDASCFAFASLVPFALIWGGATLLNLSLLSSDLWAALARFIFFEGFSVEAAISFVLAFLLVAIGLFLYSSGGDMYEKKENVEESNIESGFPSEFPSVEREHLNRSDRREKDAESQELLEAPDFEKSEEYHINVGYPEPLRSKMS